MSVSAHGHHHVLFFFQKSLRDLFWSAFLRQNGLSLVDIFTFVYLFRLGAQQHFFATFASTSFQQGILTVVCNVLLLRGVELLVLFPMSQFASRLGLPKAVILGNLLMAVRYAFLAYSAVYPGLIFTAAIIQGLEISIFSPAYNTMFAKRASKKNLGRDVGAFMFILKLSHALLPAFAGGLIVTFGFHIAFIGSVILLLLANVPLLNSAWTERLTYPTYQGFLHWMRKVVDPRVAIALTGRYMSDAAFELWPIYLLIIFGKIEQIGILMSFALFSSLILVYFSGWFVDHSRRNIPFVIGGVLLASFWILRINISVLTLIVALEVSQKIVESFFYPSFDAFIYRISKSVDTYAFHVYRELMICLVSILTWSTLGLLFFTVGYVWNLVFILGSIGILLSTLVYTIKRYE